MGTPEFTKKCTKCQETKPLDAFGKLKRGKDGYSPSCKPCNGRKPRIICLVLDGKKECTTCHSMKPLTDFSLKPRGGAGVTSRCKECTAKATATWRGLPGNLERSRQATQEWLEKPENLARHKQNTKIGEVRRKENPIYREQLRQRVTKHRSLRKGLPQIDKVDLDILYIRDKAICSLCHKYVKREDASQDHIIPVTKPGSEESYGNSALAHGECNRRKRNTINARQILLYYKGDPEIKRYYLTGTPVEAWLTLTLQKGHQLQLL